MAKCGATITEIVEVLVKIKVHGKRKRGKQRRKWENIITEWTGKSLGDNLRRAEDRER